MLATLPTGWLFYHANPKTVINISVAVKVTFPEYFDVSIAMSHARKRLHAVLFLPTVKVLYQPRSQGSLVLVPLSLWGTSSREPW